MAWHGLLQTLPWSQSLWYWIVQWQPTLLFLGCFRSWGWLLAYVLFVSPNVYLQYIEIAGNLIAQIFECWKLQVEDFPVVFIYWNLQDTYSFLFVLNVLWLFVDITWLLLAGFHFTASLPARMLSLLNVLLKLVARKYQKSKCYLGFISFRCSKNIMRQQQ